MLESIFSSFSPNICSFLKLIVPIFWPGRWVVYGSHFISHSSQLWQGGEWSLKVPKNATVNSVSKLRTFAPTTTFCFSSLSGKQSAQLNANHTIIIVVFAVVVIVVAVWVVVALVVVLLLWW